MRRLVCLLLLVPVLSLSACAGLGKTNTNGYITGDGKMDPVPAQDRGNPLVLSGSMLGGGSFNVTSTRGKVTVVNVWGSWCGACIGEAAQLQAARKQLGNGVAFVGVDIRDTARAQAQAYVRNFHITYPSIYSPDGEAMLAFSSYISPRTIPATLILDSSGRPAAIVRGPIPSTLTLVEAVQCVQNPKRPHCEGF